MAPTASPVVESPSAAAAAANTTPAPRIQQPPKQMTAEQLVKFYTDRLDQGINPGIAMRRLWTNQSSLQCFVDCGTETVVEKYDSDWQLQPMVKRLKEKFAMLREKGAKPEEEIDDDKENELDQKTVNQMFRDAMRSVATMRAAAKKTVDYSKYKITKRTASPVTRQWKKPRVSFSFD